MKRRDFIKLAGATAGASSLAGLAGCAGHGLPIKSAGGSDRRCFGGATAAKYIRMWDPSIDVVLVERESGFTSCPISNLVLAGYAGMQEISHGYGGLRRHGVQVVQDEAVAIDAAKKTVRLARGGDISYERLIVSPGIDFTFGDVQGYEAAMNAGRVLHAWKGGRADVELRRQLEQMRDGGVYVLSIPLAPIRCPPGPYERASMVAHTFKQAKPRSKVLILDANPDVTSKAGLFKAAWKDYYAGSSSIAATRKPSASMPRPLP
jgi:NADPH-dependent 2,4-dienoyl-CoA reductase/sulfur reductase-like enzyme